MGAQQAYMAPDAPCTRYRIKDPGLLGIHAHASRRISQEP